MDVEKTQQRKTTMMRVFFILAVSLLLTWMLLAPMAWLLRDGLGPDSVTSTGFEAIWRAFMTFYWGPIAGILFLLAAAFAKPAWFPRRKP